MLRYSYPDGALLTYEQDLLSTLTIPHFEKFQTPDRKPNTFNTQHCRNAHIQ